MTSVPRQPWTSPHVTETNHSDFMSLMICTVHSAPSRTWVAQVMGLPARLQRPIIIFWARKTFSVGISMPRSPRATMMPSLASMISSNLLTVGQKQKKNIKPLAFHPSKLPQRRSCFQEELAGTTWSASGVKPWLCQHPVKIIITGFNKNSVPIKWWT